jgi:hypothetical protein
VSQRRDTRAQDRAYADQVLREVCASFDAALEEAASGTVSERYAAVPSWFVDRSTARRMLGEIHGGHTRRDQ